MFAEMLLLGRPELGVVNCPLGPDGPQSASFGGVEGTDGFRGLAQVRDGFLTASVPPGSGEGTFVFPMVMRGSIEWRDVRAGAIGECVRAEVGARSEPVAAQV